MDVILLAALITAYLAGVAALFAPCCIGVLLPAYFGSIFRQRKTVVLMTVVFFFGLLIVFLPLGLGMGFLGQLFQEYHNTIYLVGSVFFLVLGLIILLGFHMSIPFRSGFQGKVTGGTSVFALGVFSGFATLCCAPVLAGALALSVLPGSVLWGGIYSVVYVIGMVSPLFIISYFLDKKDVMKKASFLKKRVTYSMLNKKISLTVSNIFSGAVFLIMGSLLLYYSLTNQLTMDSSGSSLWINIFASKLTETTTQFLSSSVGQIVSLSALVVLVVWLVEKIIKNVVHKRRDK